MLAQNGRSPLYTAARSGHMEIVKLLIEAGANINQVNAVSYDLYDYLLHAT